MSSQIRKSLTRKKIIKKKHYIYQKGQTIGEKNDIFMLIENKHVS